MESQHHAHAEPFYPDSQGNVATITCHVRNDANDHLISGLVIRLCNRIQGADIVAASQGCDRTNTKEVYAAPDDPHGANAIIEYRPTHIKTGRPISVMLAGQYHIGTCEEACAFRGTWSCHDNVNGLGNIPCYLRFDSTHLRMTLYMDPSKLCSRALSGGMSSLDPFSKHSAPYCLHRSNQGHTIRIPIPSTLTFPISSLQHGSRIPQGTTWDTGCIDSHLADALHTGDVFTARKADIYEIPVGDVRLGADNVALVTLPGDETVDMLTSTVKVQ